MESAKARDVSEADTVTIVKDILNDVFGFDKYSEVTGEFEIRGTYCDLAIRIDGKVQRLIEVKAIDLDLKESHKKQIVGYGAQQGIEWIILTNGRNWRVYQLLFQKPIKTELVFEINLLEMNPKKEDDLEMLYLLTRESVAKRTLKAYKERQEAVNRYVIAGLLVHDDDVVKAIRRELKRLSNVSVELDELRVLLREEVIKREALEGEKAKSTERKISRAANKKLRKRKKKTSQSTAPAKSGSSS